MDFLLDPNVAYLFLLGGFLLGMLALVTPGTGFFELGALFCIALAGYAVFNLSFNWWALALLLLSVVPFGYAIQRPKREGYLVLSILLIVLGSVFVFQGGGDGASVNPFVAILASTLVAGFLWIAVRGSIEAGNRRPTHDLDALVGKIGEARTQIKDEGSVQVGAELWSARSEMEIPEGSPIRVLRREGFILVVEKSNSKPSF